MNIFYLDSDPEQAAQFQCDKHVVKMVLETAQLLSTAIPQSVRDAISGSSLFYKPTHINHPCSLWARASEDNFDWLIRHGIALSNEYTFRYNKTHKSLAVILSAFKALNSNLMEFEHTGFTTPALAMPDQYKFPDPVQSYRAYYKYDKLVKISCHWTNRDIPSWIL